MKRLLIGLMLGIVIGSAVSVSVSAQTLAPTPTPVKIAPVQVEVRWEGNAGMTFYDCWPADGKQDARMIVYLGYDEGLAIYNCEWTASYNISSGRPQEGGVAMK